MTTVNGLSGTVKPSTDLTNMTNVDGRKANLVTCMSLLLRRLFFSYGRGECETRVTGDQLQGTVEKVQTAGEAYGSQCKKTNYIATCEHTTTTDR